MVKPDVDFSTLTWRDAADIALQRTSTLLNFPIIGNPGFLLWTRGSRALLNLEAMARRNAILSRAMREISGDFEAIASFLANRPINHVVDIGCGHAFIDLLLFRRFACSIHLIDIEETKEQHHDFHEKGAGYSDLSSATRFLVRNGVPREQIQTTNPSLEPLPHSQSDLVISLYSAGFHYPISEYAGFIRDTLEGGGILIFDARVGAKQLEALEYSNVTIICDRQKSQRLAVSK